MSFMPKCTDGTGHPHDVPAEGWILDPDGVRRGAMCKAHAQAVIDEYASKLGETWTFEAAPKETPMPSTTRRSRPSARKALKSALDGAIQRSLSGRPISMLDLLKIRPEAERMIAQGISIPDAAEAAVLKYAKVQP